jgi:FkbM family methyltransferase
MRRVLKGFIRISPEPIRGLAKRIPFSRLHWVLPVFLKGSEIVRWRNGVFQVNPGEIHGYYLFFFNQYGEEEIDYILQKCANASVFVDVGANIGFFSVALAQNYPSLKVIAFEPDPYIVRRLTDNITLNPAIADQIHVVPYAVADVDGEVSFASSSQSYNAEIGRITTQSTHANITKVQTTTLDSFCQKAGLIPDVVKIDVEGTELSVLRGMQSLLKNNKLHFILLEVHAFYLPEAERVDFNRQIEQLLIASGFSLYDLSDRALMPAVSWPPRLHIAAVRTHA